MVQRLWSTEEREVIEGCLAVHERLRQGEHRGVIGRIIITLLNPCSGISESHSTETGTNILLPAPPDGPAPTSEP